MAIAVCATAWTLYEVVDRWLASQTRKVNTRVAEALADYERAYRLAQLEMQEKLREKEDQNQSLRDEVKRLLARLIFTTNELRCDDKAPTMCLPDPSQRRPSQP